MTTLLQQRAQPISRWLQKLPHADVIGASLLMTALLVVFFWRAILMGESLLPADLIYELDPVWRNHAPIGFTTPGNSLLSDQVYQFYPWQVEVRRAFSERRLPLWTPNVNNGQPMMGNGQSGVWNPFGLITYLIPLQSSSLAVAILKLWVGGIGTFLLARQLGIGRHGAILAMVTFAFSGPVLVWLGYPHTNVIVWLPLLLYLGERALIAQTAGPVIAMSLVLAGQFLGGHPETSFHVLVTWFAFCLARAVARYGWHLRSLSRVLGRMALAGVIGVALAAVQLLPLVETILSSTIMMDRQASVLTGVSLLRATVIEWHNWPTLVTTILPQFFGTPVNNSYWYPYQNYNEQTFYAGIVPMALGVVTLLTWWRDRRQRTIAQAGPEAFEGSTRGFWIALTLIVMGIAAQLPLFNVVNVLPFLRLAAHGRLRFVYALGLALVAGYGLDTLVKNQTSSFNAPVKFLVVLSVLSIASLVLVAGAFVGVTVLHDPFIAEGRRQAEAVKAADHPMFPYSLDYYYERVRTRYEQARRLYTPATPEMFLPVGIALAAGLLEWRRRRGGRQSIWVNGLVLLTCVDLFVMGIRINPTMPPAQIYPATDAIEFLKRQPGLFRVSGLYLALMPNSSMVLGLSDVRGSDPVTPWRQTQLLSRAEGAIRVGYYSLLRSANDRLLDLMNVEYMVADREVGGRWKLVFAEKGSPIRVYRNPNVLPRAFIVYQSEHAANAEAALNRLLDKDFDFRTRVILEGKVIDQPAVMASPQTGLARIAQYEPERVVIETDTGTDGILVLTDTYAPGWQARVDGRPTPVYVADYTFRAVRISAGQHLVEFVYAPTSFAIGAVFSLAAVAGLVWISIRALALRRQSEGQPA